MRTRRAQELSHGPKQTVSQLPDYRDLLHRDIEKLCVMAPQLPILQGSPKQLQVLPKQCRLIFFNISFDLVRVSVWSWACAKTTPVQPVVGSLTASILPYAKPRLCFHPLLEGTLMGRRPGKAFDSLVAPLQGTIHRQRAASRPGQQ